MPSITLTKDNSVVKDTYVHQLTPTVTWDTAPNMYIGNNGGAGQVDRSFIKFDLGLIPNDATINSATLQLYQASGPSVAGLRELRAHVLTQDLSNPSWNTQPSFDSSKYVSVSIDQTIGAFSVDVKTLVQDWVSGVRPNYGLVLKENDEVTINTTRNLATIENATVAQRPKLTIDYTIPTTGKKQVEVIKGSDHFGSTATTSYTPTLPVSAQVGDLISYLVSINGSNTINTPAGWNKQYDVSYSASNREALFTKVMAEGEVAPVFTANGAVNWWITSTVFRNVKSVLTAGANSFSTNLSGFYPPTKTVAVNKSLFVLFNTNYNNGTGTPPLSYSELQDTTVGSYLQHEISYRYLHNNLSQTTAEMTTVLSAANTGHSGVLVLEPLTNNTPTLSLSSPANNQTLTEGSTYTLAGTVSDPDNGNAVTVKYAINGGTARNITSAISDGVSPIPFSKALTFQNGRLYDGATDVSGPLAENTTYTVNVYAVDDQGGTSASYTRSFTVILNRPPNIMLDAYSASRTGLSELEALTFTGKVTDPENDNVNLTVAFNGGDPVPLKAGVPSGTTFEYAIPVSALVNGTSTVIFTATDTKGAAKTKTLTFAKSGTQTPVKTAVVRYAITPPLGTTAEIVAWVNREAGDLIVAAARSVVASNAAESFVAMTKNASVPIGDGTIYEDEFVGTATPAGAKVTLKLTLTRTDSASTKAIKKIMGGIG